MPTLQVTPDCNLYYEVTDFAEPWREHETILLLHGNAESGEAYYGWMPELARDIAWYGPTCAASGARRRCRAIMRGRSTASLMILLQ